MGMTRVIRPIGVTIPALASHGSEHLRMSAARSSSGSHVRAMAACHRANGRSIVKRARAGGDLAAFIQTGNPMTPRIAELVFAFSGPTGEKKWASVKTS